MHVGGGLVRGGLVLIEPCGIEIRAQPARRVFRAVLIEPCGIEILNAKGRPIPHKKVLIEPCGIEIKFTGVRFGHSD